MVEMTQEEKHSGRENKHCYRHCYLKAYISGANKKYWDSGCKIFFTLTRCEQTQHFTNVGKITNSLEYLPTLIYCCMQWELLDFFLMCNSFTKLDLKQQTTIDKQIGPILRRG